MLANEQGVLCKLKMTLLTILNEIPKKTPAFFLAKPARFGSKKCHQKDISTINAQSIYAKIVSITNIFTSAFWHYNKVSRLDLGLGISPNKNNAKIRLD